MVMISGLLKHKIQLEKYITTIDSIGLENNSWVSTGKTIYASMSDEIISNSEGDKMNIETIITFIIRYKDNVDYSYRIKYKNEYYKILTIKEIPRRKSLVIKCKRFEGNNYG